MVDLVSTELRRLRIATVVIAVAGCVWAWHNRFVQDDAFISFRYSEHLANGHGLVWNMGGRIEGFTNFLWTILIAAGIWCGADPVYVSYALGLCCLAGCLYVSARLAHGLVSAAGENSDATRTRAHYAALIVVLLLVTNFSFSSYGTSGLETCSQALLFTLALLIATHAEARGWTLRRLLSLSFVVALAIWTRLDSAIILACVAPIAIYRTLMPRNREQDNGGRAIRLLAAAAPATALIALLLAFKLIYFGKILPNTYHAKAEGALASNASLGWAYVLGFVSTYALFVPISIVLAYAVIRRSVVVAVGLAGILLWLAYVVRVGGDFMEFRLMMPILPILFAYFATSIVHLPRWAFAAVVSGCVIASIVFARADNTHSVAGLDCTSSIARLQRSAKVWSTVGRALGKKFRHDSTVLLSTGAAGAIPYYSRLSILDELGLNDAYIARNGDRFRACPGHQRRAPAAYLIERRVNLVLNPSLDLLLSRPRAWTVPEVIDTFLFNPPRDFKLPDTAKLVEFPVSHIHRIPLLYLFPHPTIDSAIENGQWQVHDLAKP